MKRDEKAAQAIIDKFGLQCKIIPYGDKEEWLRLRHGGVGGSDISCLSGTNPWKTYDDLWKEKVHGIKQAFSPEARKRMNRGSKLEPLIRDWYRDYSGCEVHEVPAILQGKNEWELASVDGVIQCGNHLHGIEIKTTGKTVSKVDANYNDQIQWYMHITGIQNFVVVYACGTGDSLDDLEMRIFNVPRDEERIAHLAGLARQFWEKVQFAAINPIHEQIQIIQGALEQIKKLSGGVE